ncbi:MAG TPA: CHAD domain-containing protein [Ktedonobacterales bacterium]
MEIEAKYALTGPLEPADLEAADLHLYQLHSTGDERHHDVLLDTSMRALAANKRTLRLRHRDDGRVIATYKGANSESGAVHSRDEVEAQVSETEPDGGQPVDAHRLPPALAERVGPLVGDAPLAPLVETHIHRQTWSVLRDGQAVAEIALDNGDISANGLTAPVHELEVEIKDEGAHADLDALGHLLTQQFSLAPEPRSKLERGLVLLDRERILAARRPLEEVGRDMVAEHLKNLHKHEPGVREGSDPEAIHKMRVATRRLRTTLQALQDAPIFDQKQVGRLRRFRRGLKVLARSLGEVRDLDVLGERVRAYVQAQPDLATDLAPLIDLLDARRQTAYTRLSEGLDSHELARTLEQLDEFTQRPIAPPAEQPPLLVKHFAGGAIWRRYEAVMRYETVVATAPPLMLHQVRIACKQLRYAVELFEDALSVRAQALLDILVHAQDHLGNLHDAIVALDLVNEVRDKHPKPGLDVYAAALEAERDQLHRTFAPLWRQISGPAFHDDMLSTLGAL